MQISLFPSGPTDASKDGLGTVLYQGQDVMDRVILMLIEVFTIWNKLPSSQTWLFSIEMGRNR